jgi:TIR domain/Novel STAND NTPase 1
MTSLNKSLQMLGKILPPLLNLQIWMPPLVEGSRDRIITLSDWSALRDSLSQYLERIWSSAEETDRQRIRSLLIRLVTSEGTLRAVPLDELPEDDRPQVHRLVNVHVLRLRLDQATQRTFVEITHAPLVELWPRYKGWLVEERDFLTLRGPISEAAELWASRKRDSSYLLSSWLLSQARELLETRSNDLTLLERSFVEQSVRASDQFSSWRALTRGLGFAKIERKLVEREERRTKLLDSLSSLEKQERELEARRLQLSEQLDQQRKETDALTPKIFLSYASEDFPYVKPFYDKLKENGLRPWLDREDLLPGVDWDREIVRQIKQSHFVLFCITQRSRTKRGYIQKELGTALKASQEIPSGETFLIPVRLEECTVPDELSKLQYADIFRTGEFEKLLKSMFVQWAKSQQRM